MGVFDGIVNVVKAVKEKLLKPRRDVYLRRVRDRIAPVLAADVASNFVGSHAPDGTPWAPLRYRTGLPLILTGQLMADSVLAAQNVAVTLSGFVMTLDNPFYGIFHQRPEGFKAHGVYVPPRPFFGVSGQAFAAVGDVVRDVERSYIGEALDGVVKQAGVAAVTNTTKYYGGESAVSSY